MLRLAGRVGLKVMERPQGTNPTSSLHMGLGSRLGPTGVGGVARTSRSKMEQVPARAQIQLVYALKLQTGVQIPALLLCADHF